MLRVSTCQYARWGEAAQGSTLTYVVYGIISGVDGVSSWVAPLVEFIPVNDGITALEILRVLQEGVVLGGDVFLSDFLLNDFLTPVVVQPRVHHALLICRCFQEGVRRSGNIEINP